MTITSQGQKNVSDSKTSEHLSSLPFPGRNVREEEMFGIL